MKDKTIFMQKFAVVVLLATICDLLWGSAFPCIKLGYKFFNISSDDTASQIFFAGLRFTLAGLLVIIFMSFVKRRFLVPQSMKPLDVFHCSVVFKLFYNTYYFILVLLIPMV